jgi:hypothetical protein
MRGRRLLAGSIAILTGCQLVSGLDDLETRDPASPATSSTGGGGTAGGGGGGGTAGAGGDMECPMPPNPSACVVAPMSCEGGCVNTPYECVVTCEADGGDMGCAPPMPPNTIHCGPPEYNVPCHVLCQGGCVGKTIDCPEEQPCLVDCNVAGDCFGTTVACKHGPCNIRCMGGACDMTTTIQCGTHGCVANCQPGTTVNMENEATSCFVSAMGCGS